MNSNVCTPSASEEEENKSENPTKDALEQNEKCGVGKLQIMQIDKNCKLAKLFRVQSYTKCKFDKGHSSHQTDQVDKIDKTDLGDQTHRVEQTIPIEYNTRPMVLHCY